MDYSYVFVKCDMRCDETGITTSLVCVECDMRDVKEPDLQALQDQRCKFGQNCLDPANTAEQKGGAPPLVQDLSPRKRSPQHQPVEQEDF